MKLVKLSAHCHAVLQSSGQQVVFEKDVPIALRTEAGKWYRNREVATQETDRFLDRYLKAAKPESLEVLDANYIQFMVDRL